jgi:hypothetical protein
MSVELRLFQRVEITNILEAGIDWSSFAMTENHLDLLQLEICRVESGEFLWGVRCAWYERGHVEVRV